MSNFSSVWQLLPIAAKPTFVMFLEPHKVCDFKPVQQFPMAMRLVSLIPLLSSQSSNDFQINKTPTCKFTNRHKCKHHIRGLHALQNARKCTTYLWRLHLHPLFFIYFYVHLVTTRMHFTHVPHCASVWRLIRLITSNIWKLFHLDIGFLCYWYETIFCSTWVILYASSFILWTRSALKSPRRIWDCTISQRMQTAAATQWSSTLHKWPKISCRHSSGRSLIRSTRSTSKTPATEHLSGLLLSIRLLLVVRESDSTKINVADW